MPFLRPALSHAPLDTVRSAPPPRLSRLLCYRRLCSFLLSPSHTKKPREAPAHLLTNPLPPIFSLSSQTVLTTPLFRDVYGVDPADLGYVWVAGPLSGLVVQVRAWMGSGGAATSVWLSVWLMHVFSGRTIVCM